MAKLIAWFLEFLACPRPRNVTHCLVQGLNELANGEEDM